jgi:hypothetical protein
MRTVRPPDAGRRCHTHGEHASRLYRNPGGTTQANALSDRCALIGGSDARIILGDDEAAPLLLWTEKRDRVPAGR